MFVLHQDNQRQEKQIISTKKNKASKTKWKQPAEQILERILIARMASSSVENLTNPCPVDRPFSSLISANFTSPEQAEHSQLSKVISHENVTTRTKPEIPQVLEQYTMIVVVGFCRLTQIRSDFKPLAEGSHAWMMICAVIYIFQLKPMLASLNQMLSSLHHTLHYWQLLLGCHFTPSAVTLTCLRFCKNIVKSR